MQARGIHISIVTALMLFSCAAIAAPPASSSLTVGSLSPSRLKTELQSLSPEARQRAMATLQHIYSAHEGTDCLFVDKEGGISIACQGPAAPVVPIATAIADTPPTGVRVAITNPPHFHSRPGATKVIYLDFNGHLISGTQFNDTFNSGNDLHARAFSIDADFATFNAQEQEVIRRTWERVADDFAPFDVDVTTEEPTTFTPTTARALITRDDDENGANMPAAGAGGFAYLGHFGSATFVSRHSPALIYYDNHFAQWDLLAQTASHEVGHNLGLDHDGVIGVERYSGHGSAFAATSWVPIMGNSGRKGTSQWSKGQYFNASQTQDDLAIMAAKLAFRVDDHANTTGAASPLEVDDSGVLSVTNGGIIERDSDRDVFMFDTGIGEMNLQVTPWISDDGEGGHNLDVVALLFDNAGTLVASNNPATELSASLSHTSSGGRYFVGVENTGAGTPLNDPPSGFTAYGSLGHYRISGTLPPKTIRVRTPNGDEGWFAGRTNTIAWVQGSNAASQIRIDLLHRDDPVRLIVGSSPNDGTFEWAIPHDLAPSPNYRVRIQQLSDGLRDNSDAEFVIFDQCDSFETDFGNWLNVAGDDFDWARDSDGTPSPGTGPIQGTRGSAFYAYTEATGNIPNRSAFLERTGIDFSDDKKIRLGFDFHMHGLGQGTLALDLFNGTWHSNLWSISGQQHDATDSAWSNAVVNLDPFAGQDNITLRLRGQTGNDFRSDMAVDCIWLVTRKAQFPTNGLLIQLSALSPAGEHLTP